MDQNPHDQGEAYRANVLTSDDLQRCLHRLEAAGLLRMSLPNMHDDGQSQAFRKASGRALDSEEYLDWINNEHSQLLRLTWSPSSRKTMISKYLVEKLKSKIRNAPGATLACFFCDKQEHGGDTPVAIVRSLLFQLLMQKSGLYEYIRADFKKEASGGYFDDHLNDFSGLWRNFRDMLQDEQAGPVFIVVNALDACHGPTRADLLHSIKDLFHHLPSRPRVQVKLLVTYECNSIDIDDGLGQAGIVLDLDERTMRATLAETPHTGPEGLVTAIKHGSHLRAFEKKNEEYISMMKLLLKKGANMISKDNRYGRSPLSWAAGSGQEPMVKLLMEKGVDIGCRDNLGQTPLSFAAEKGHEAVVRLLVDSGGYIDTKDWNGYTPLLRAVKNGHLPIVRLLLENGASVHCKSNNGQTPVSFAAEHGHPDIVHVLLANGAAADSADLAYGRTPLSRAAEKGHENICEILCKKSAEVIIDSKDVHRQTPLLWAVRNGHQRSVKRLLHYGASTGVRDSRFNQTPLIFACKNGHDSIAKVLIDNKADVDLRDESGRTALSWAAGNGESDVIEPLLKRGAKVNYSDQDGRTPLSWAAGNGQTQSVRQLLDHNAESTLRDRHGRTPLSWAMENAFGHIVTMLRGVNL